MISEDIFKKISTLSHEVKKELRSKGIILPVELPNGNIVIGSYTVSKNRIGFYSVYNRYGEVVAERINLPQTALIIANDLALGKFLNQGLLEHDHIYGFSVFEEQLQKKSMELGSDKGMEHLELATTKWLIARSKKERHKTEILQKFENLSNSYK